MWTRWQLQSSISTLRTLQSWLKRMQKMLKQPPRSFGTAKWRHKKVAVPLPQATATAPHKVSREPYPGHLQYTNVRQGNQEKHQNYDIEVLKRYGKNWICNGQRRNDPGGIGYPSEAVLWGCGFLLWLPYPVRQQEGDQSMNAVNKAIDSMTGSRWRRFLALVALGMMIGQAA